MQSFHTQYRHSHFLRILILGFSLLSYPLLSLSGPWYFPFNSTLTLFLDVILLSLAATSDTQRLRPAS